MSTSLYRWSEACEGRECPGDCDHCHENEEAEDDIQTRVPKLPVVLSSHIRQAQMREGRQRQEQRGCPRLVRKVGTRGCGGEEE